MDGYEKLANAIVVQAAKDYFNLCAGFPISYSSPSLPSYLEPTIDSVEQFFHSDWYKILTDADPDYILTYVKKEAKKMVLEYTVSKQRGSSMYYVNRVGATERLSPVFPSKKKALHKAAEMQGISYRLYMKIRRRDGVDNVKSN